jgi:hypothetical protein
VKTLNLDILKYPVYACWVTIPALFSSIVDFEDPNNEAGIHVHARIVPHTTKVIDDTFQLVNITLANQTIEITLESCIAYLLANMVNNTLEALHCPNCGLAHIDEFEYALIPHQVHICKACDQLVSIPKLQQLLGYNALPTISQLSKLAIDTNRIINCYMVVT